MTVRRNRYQMLKPEARDLILGWFDRAWRARECTDEDSFEPFIFCWIAFNAWGCCVANEEQDRPMVRALASSDDIGSAFAAKIADQSHPLATCAPTFQDMWPIFKVQDFRRRGIYEHPPYDSRAERIRDYIAQGATNYEPKVPGDPVPIGTQISLSWKNTLPAIYRVRCNLFHGEKSVRDEQDQRIVGAAFRVLVFAFKEFL